jgi:hypothetical protein
MRPKRHAGSTIPGAFAVATSAALFCAIFVFGLSGTPACAQSVAVPTFNPYSKIEVKQPDATTVPKTSWPLLPHETLNAPLPKKPGCFHLVDDSWQEVPCTPEKDIKNLPRPVVADTIQSFGSDGSQPTPLVWGAVATSLTDPEQSSEIEQVYSTSNGKTTMNKYPDTWSIQNNTNGFKSSTSKKGYPFSLSEPGDSGWVQFVYQQSGDNHGNDTVGTSRLCVWVVDTSVACRQTSPGNGCTGDGYQAYCVSPFNTGNISPLTGQGSPSGFSEVAGYIQCGNTPNTKNVGPNGCTLWVLGYLANAQDPGWWAGAAPDSMGLANNWTSLGGSLYGEGNGGEAVFTNATLNTNVIANSCNTSTTPPSNPGSIFTPTQCSPDSSPLDLYATLASTGGDGTAEYNNFISGAATFACTWYECRLGWAGTTDQFTTKTKVSSSENPSYYGDTVTFTAAVTSPGGTPTGTVQFVVDGQNFGGPVSLSGGNATVQETWLAAGNHTITAKYSGAKLFETSSGSLSGGQKVDKQQTDTRVSSSENPSYYGDTVTFTAEVSDRDDTVAGGTVQFVVDGKNFGAPVSLSGGYASIQETWLTGGKHTVTAKYGGDGNHLAGSGGLSGGQTVNKQQTDTRVSSSEDPSYYGDTVTFTAEVSDRDDTTAGGTVQFVVDGKNFGGPVSLSGGYATIQETWLAAGNHTVTANYSGDVSHLPSSGALNGPQTVNKQQTDTRVSSSADPSTLGQAVTFTAEVNDRDDTIAGGTVQFVVDGSTFGKPVTLSGGSATSASISSLRLGNHTVTANYSGDGNHLAGSGDLNGGQTVNKAAGTTTVGSGANPSTYGQSVTFTANVAGVAGIAAPTGAVQFVVNGANYGNPVPLTTIHLDKFSSMTYATISDSLLSVGNHTVTASYSGDANYAANTGTLSGGQTVNQASSKTTISSGENPSYYGDSVIFTAAVTSPGGTPTGSVQFLVDGQNFGAPAVLSGGSATIQETWLAAGKYTVTAKYYGDANHLASSGALSGGQTVNKQQTDTRVSSSENPSYYGDTVTFTAEVSDRDDTTAGGTVQFVVDGKNFGAPVSLSGGYATIQETSFAAGNHTVTANYSGDGSHLSSSGALNGPQTVKKQQTDTRVSSSADPSTLGEAVTFTAEVSDRDDTTAGGTVQFQVDGKNFGAPVSLSGGYATIQETSLAVGNHTVTANYSGDGNHLAGSGDLEGGQTVNKATATITVTSSENPSNYYDSVTFTASLTGPGGYPTGTVQFQVDGTDLGSPQPLKLSHLLRFWFDTATSPATYSIAPGNHTITAVYSGDSNYTGGSNTLSGSQTVNKLQTSTSLTSSDNSPTYGEMITLTATVTETTGNSRDYPSGNVQFMQGSTIIGTAALSTDRDTLVTTAAIQYTFGAFASGNYTFTAKYQGDNYEWLPSSGSLTLYVIGPPK